ncbi:hypothetical protein RHI9324_01693 [Rhizobium sp. CECT 9324]|nr:hypothetical protein RHI9324_01693 [Rhizobium sp. CECT 9324]
MAPDAHKFGPAVIRFEISDPPLKFQTGAERRRFFVVDCGLIGCSFREPTSPGPIVLRPCHPDLDQRWALPLYRDLLSVLPLPLTLPLSPQAGSGKADRLPAMERRGQPQPFFSPSQRGEDAGRQMRGRRPRQHNTHAKTIAPAQIPRMRGSPPPSSISAVSAQTSASSRSGERPLLRPSGPKSHIWSSIAENRAACTTRPCS